MGEMSSRIQLLPETLVNKIAAGEVVERPASVVKELLENSIDARATRIVIELEAGGKRLIRVSDNGEGMSADDALLAIERHATSKIKNEADLFSIRSLGFRGEALPSIASVSRLLLKTRDDGSELGSSIRVEGGVVREVKKEAMPRGTSIEARSLFFNVPARRKFLKSVETELGHVAELVNKIAFAYPGVSFELFSQDKPMLRAAAASKIEDRAYQLLGGELTSRLIPIETEFPESLPAGPLAIRGLISPADLTFSTTRHLYLYINRRYVRDKLLTHSILEAYRTLIPKMRYPAVILFLDMPAEEVDVNVHPTKLEVRFPHAAQIYQAVISALQPALLARPKLFVAPETKTEEHKARVEQAMQKYFENRPDFKLAPKPVQPKISALYNKPALSQPDKKIPAPQMPQQPKPAEPVHAPALGEEKTAAAPGTDIFSSLRVIGQFHSNYLVLESEDSLVIIDQHAAHERINFDKLKMQLENNRVSRQNLLFPEVVELSFSQAQTIGQNLDLIESLGFEIQPFGGNSFVVKSTPGLLENLEVSSLISDLADELAEVGKISSMDERIDHLLSVVACHSSVRAGKTLSEPEIQALLKDLDQNPFPGQCPHGRPAIWKITLKELDKKFAR
jgi:DNA mismatch repair protein MutL